MVRLSKVIETLAEIAGEGIEIERDGSWVTLEIEAEGSTFRYEMDESDGEISSVWEVAK